MASDGRLSCGDGEAIRQRFSDSVLYSRGILHEPRRQAIDLGFLPSASPELQPSEKLWPLSNEGVANRHFEQIEDLEEALIEHRRGSAALP
jgi:hypothetical protein